MKIELLYIEDCPSLLDTEEMIEKELKDLEMPETKVQKVLVNSYDQAEKLKFLGSPTIRVNGADIDPDSSRKKGYEISCRVYHVKGRSQGIPYVKWLKDALRKAKAEDEAKAEKATSTGKKKFGAKPLPKPRGVKTFTEAKKAKRGKK